MRATCMNIGMCNVTKLQPPLHATHVQLVYEINEHGEVFPLFDYILSIHIFNVDV